MTAPTHSLSSSLSTSPKGVDQLAREAGMPLPKVDEKCAFRAFKTFLSKTGLIVPLRARGRGLSTAAHSNLSVEFQGKDDFLLIRNQIESGVFSGDQLGDQLGINWGSIKTNLVLHVTFPWFAWVVMGNE